MPLLRWSLSGALLLCAACSLDPASSGERCTRSAQCKAGLACVFPTGDGSAREGRCSADLSSLYDPSQVPMLTPDAGARMVAMPPADAGANGDASVTAAPDAG
jgi:hypothetical protein